MSELQDSLDFLERKLKEAEKRLAWFTRVELISPPDARAVFFEQTPTIESLFESKRFCMELRPYQCIQRVFQEIEKGFKRFQQKPHTALLGLEYFVSLQIADEYYGSPGVLMTSTADWIEQDGIRFYPDFNQLSGWKFIYNSKESYAEFMRDRAK